MQRAFSKCMATLRWIRLLTQERKTACAHIDLVAFHTWTTQGEYRLWVPHTRAEVWTAHGEAHVS